MEQQVIAYKGSKVNVYSQGDLSKKAFVFIHGNSLSSRVFFKQFEAIKNIPLVAIDLPGHGDSEPAAEPEKTYSIPGFVDAVKFILDHLQLKEFILVGHSLGGHITIEASNELKGLKGLIISGTPPVGVPPALDKAFLPNPAMPLLFKEQLDDTEIEQLAASMTDSTHVTNLKHEIKIADGKMRSCVVASIAQGLHKNELDILMDATVPLAIIHGENDALINKDYFDGLQAPTLWRNKVQFIQDASHCPQLEQSDRFNELLNIFYSQ